MIDSFHQLSDHTAYQLYQISGMRGFSNFFQGGGINFDNVILVDEGIQISLKAGHHRRASETPLQWRFAGVQMMVKH